MDARGRRVVGAGRGSTQALLLDLFRDARLDGVQVEVFPSSFCFVGGESESVLQLAGDLGRQTG